MKRPIRIVAAAVVLAVVVAACGSRVKPLSDTAGGPQGFATGPGGVQTTGPGGLQTTGPGGLQTTGPGGQQTTGPGILPGCRGGASDTGITANSIRLGAVTSVHGPLPGAFNAAIDAVDAHFKMINEQGGICGRFIEYRVEDDAGDPNRNKSKAKQLVLEDKIFAFVGAHSSADAGLGEISKQYKVPDIGFSLAFSRAANPYSYGFPGQVQPRWIGQGASGTAYLNAANDIEQVALFWITDAEVSPVAAWQFEVAMKRATKNAIDICFEGVTTILNPSFDQLVVQMANECDENVTAVYTTMENNANIRLAQTMRGQGFNPKVFAPTFTSYHPFFVNEDPDATEGAYVAMPQIPFERCARRGQRFVAPCKNAELERYVNALARYRPNADAPGSFGAPAWGQAALFVEAAKQCGAQLTRTCLKQKLDSMPPFTPGGFLSPTAPGSHRVYTCDLLVQVRSGRFVEVQRPAGRPGAPGAPDFWNCSELIDVFTYFCHNKDEFPDREERDEYFAKNAKAQGC